MDRKRKAEGADGSGALFRARSDEWGKPEPPVVAVEKEKANFGLTGALAKDKKTGNTFNGVLLKWSEPPDAAQPNAAWRLYVFKADELVNTLHIHRQSAFLVGRDDRIADILLDHPSCSKQHAVIQYRLVSTTSKETGKTTRSIKPYIMDLGSANKTLLNGRELEDARYYELREKDMIQFGASSRQYVLILGDAEASKSSK
jgi:smad nuclear-interacting protein 1